MKRLVLKLIEKVESFSHIKKTDKINNKDGIETKKNTKKNSFKKKKFYKKKFNKKKN